MLRAHARTPIEELKRCLASFHAAPTVEDGRSAKLELIAATRTIIETPDYDTKALQDQLSDDEYHFFRDSQYDDIKKEILQLPDEIEHRHRSLIYYIWFPDKSKKAKELELHLSSPTTRQRNVPSSLAQALALALSRNTILESLTLCGGVTSLEDIREIGNAITKNKKLAEVAIQTYEIDDESISILIKSISHSKTIREISLTTYNIGNKSAIALKHLLASVDTQSSLVTLGMSIEKITTENLNIISEGLAANTTLEVIDMRDVVDEQVKLIVESVKNHPSIKRLCFPTFSSPSLGPKGASSIANALLERKSNLMPISLELHNQPIGDEGVSALCELIIKNKILQLNITKCKVSNEEKMRLFNALSTSSVFCELSIGFDSNNPFDSRIGSHLNETLIRNKRIKKLYVQGFYTESGLSQIERLLKESNGVSDITFSMTKKETNPDTEDYVSSQKSKDSFSQAIEGLLRENFRITALENHDGINRKNSVEKTLERNRKISEIDKKLTSIFSSASQSKKTLLKINDDTLITHLKQSISDIIKELVVLFQHNNSDIIEKCPAYQACLQLLQLIEICTDTYIDVESSIQRLSLLKELGFEEISDTLCENLISRLLTETSSSSNPQSEECHYIRLHILIIAHLLSDENETNEYISLSMQSLMQTPEEIQSNTFSNKTLSEYQSDIRFNERVIQPINDICTSLGIETPHIFHMHPTAPPAPDLQLLPAVH